jgi:2-polyprenyl-6-methoxyphenol hydroxylase-like FAD-dependent oxidoreductase
MTPEKILIIGGGIAGMSAAIQLRKGGAHVDLVEIDPHWRVYGAGITLSGPTLRGFTEIGVIDAIMERGWCADGLDVCAPTGQKLAEIPTPRTGRPDVPGGGGILRPMLARILRHHTLASGTSVRCGTSFKSIEPVGDKVRVTFTDGRREEYDLVVGADGLNSKVRGALFPGAPEPEFTGQGSWRAVVPRPADIVRAAMYMGPSVKAGVNPVSKDEMYLFVTERRETAEHIADERLPDELRRILAPFAGVVGQIRDALDAQSRIVYRPFFALLVKQPWHQGRVVLIGDAVHATTPHLASGAGIGIEDAIVLAQELSASSDVTAALERFNTRRFPRCRMVVENSLRLGEMERSGAPKEAHETLMRESIGALLAPI